MASPGSRAQVPALIVLVALVSGCSPEPEAFNDYADRVRAAMQREHVPGVAIAVLRNCAMDSVLAFGTADARTGSAVTESTVFEAASLSKPVFAYLYLQQVDAGNLNLDEPLGETFTFARAADSDHYPALTPRHILTHRSGLPNWARRDSETGLRGLLTFKNPPGSEFGYSGEGYEMLQAYLAEHLETSFEAAFATSLSETMPLSTLGPRRPGSSPAFGHGDNGQPDRELSNPETASAAHSLRTVAADYAQFTSRVCRGEGLSREMHQEMLRPQSPAPPNAWKRLTGGIGGEVSWGLGWGVIDIDDRRLHFHWGDNGAFKSLVVFDQASGDGVVYFANAENGLEILQDIAEPILGITLEPLAKWL